MNGKCIIWRRFFQSKQFLKDKNRSVFCRKNKIIIKAPVLLQMGLFGVIKLQNNHKGFFKGMQNIYDKIKIYTNTPI